MRGEGGHGGLGCCLEYSVSVVIVIKLVLKSYLRLVSQCVVCRVLHCDNLVLFVGMWVCNGKMKMDAKEGVYYLSGARDHIVPSA